MGPTRQDTSTEFLRPDSERNAFTLIELLVTVVILSTGIVLILQAFQTSMVALAESRDSLRSAALRHALMVQTELDLLGEGGRDGVPDAVLRARYPDYRWRVDTRPEGDRSCTNSPWLKHAITVVVQHETTGREAGVETWVLTEAEEGTER